MAAIKVCNLLLLLFAPMLAAYLVRGSINQPVIPSARRVLSSSPLYVQGPEAGKTTMTSSRRLMIGSVAPTCTFNECRGCKHKCRAEQVPVERNDPINSAYRYKCVCHT